MKKSQLILILAIFAVAFTISNRCFAAENIQKKTTRTAFIVSSNNNEIAHATDGRLSELELASSYSSYSYNNNFKKYFAGTFIPLRYHSGYSPNKFYRENQFRNYSGIVFLLIFPFHAFW